MIDHIYSIHFADGQLAPYVANVRSAHCSRCRKAIPPGQGHRFYRARFSEMRKGFWCGACVSVLLSAVTRWAWNGFVTQLYPANEDTTRPISGTPLAAAWDAGGYHELGAVLESIK